MFGVTVTVPSAPLPAGTLVGAIALVTLMVNCAVTASTEIDREDWGLTYNQALEPGGGVSGKKITIEIAAEAVKQG